MQRVVARSSQIDFIVELAATGMRPAFLPRMIAEQRKHLSIAWVPLDEADMDWHIAVIWRRGAYLSHAARAWLDLVACTRGDDHTSSN
ncbi:LysR substrate-binding domain-containing protein [Bradyrhizobium sp. CCGUVB14]|uniref:LysR substrate-binding domain-containing protein n=1 Tax=unclassified Bradyrhizobium TaxID=2631580 RepID=UPI0035C16A4A